MLRNLMARRGMALAVLAAAAGAVVLYALNLWFGPLNQDEGWYLYAALETGRGRMLYRDFLFTQGPVLPVLYGWLAPLWSPAGVAGGRALTALLGLAGGVLAALLAARVVSRERRVAAAVVTFALVSFNIYHSYFTTIPKTYALAAVLLLAGYLALADAAAPRRAWLAAVAGALLAAAAGTRLSLGAVLPVAGLWLLWRRRDLPYAWLWFGFGGAIGLAAVYGPYLLAAPEQFRFAQTFHAGRAGGGALFVAGSLARCVRGYLPLWLAVGSVGVWLAGTRGRAFVAAPSLACPPALWLLSFAAVFGVHLLSPFPYDDYQTPVMPLLAAAAGAAAAVLVPVAARVSLVWLALAAAVCQAAASPLAQDWFVVRQDRFWVVKREASDLARLRQAGRWIRDNSPADRPLLTPDLYLAVESGRRVPAGFEMGPFGYFPDLDSRAAANSRVLNRPLLLQTLRRTDAPLAAFSGYAFAIGAPAMRPLTPEEQAELWQVVADRYDCVETFADFGQGSTKLGDLETAVETFNVQLLTFNVQRETRSR